jgi:hypothetical protein
MVAFFDPLIETVCVVEMTAAQFADLVGFFKELKTNSSAGGVSLSSPNVTRCHLSTQGP